MKKLIYKVEKYLVLQCRYIKKATQLVYEKGTLNLSMNAKGIKHVFAEAFTLEYPVLVELWEINNN